MKDKNGFTLIELLAIIIILAIIAVITVPVILDIIDKSKEGAITDSAYGYVDSVNQLYYSLSIDDMDSDISNGSHTVSELKTMGIVVNGKEPSEGWVNIYEGNVISYSLKFDDYVVSKGVDGDPLVVLNGKLKLAPDETDVEIIIASLSGEEKEDGATYIKNGIEIYYNPVSGELCNSSDSVSTTGTVTGCMHWYLYSVKGDYANMLLDHNITELKAADGAWISSDKYNAESAAAVGITYPGIETFLEWGYGSGKSYNARGPVTALNTLKSLTNGWNGTQTPKVPNSSSTNEYIITKDKNDNKYQIDYTGYKARLITKDEAAYLGCTFNRDSCPEWVQKGTEYDDSSEYWHIYGYWTSSPCNSENLSIISQNAYAYVVDRILALNSSYAQTDTEGIRPVITVKITDVLTELLN